ncbi:cysteine desulfurase family protein [Lactococcus termiticola]|uniref:Cysteine desulfurase n=1 Tax=Lactococcus termiticola TaxID=2169526 RepID=A0A2R5HJW7_9LACT|nr:cysteine desulfurase family protein [Lactococcus termiticola]GBG96998.1 cysteine desulfurase [Lactococcus termiticola]
MIYLDNAATTAVLPEVAQSVTDTLLSTYGNPSSIHGLGREAAKVLRSVRESIALLLDAKQNEITFTSGGSESNNTAIIAYALANQEKGKHLITTAIEHPSVLKAMAYLEERLGFEVSYVQPNPDGSYTAELFEQVLRPDSILLSMMWANNETGQLMPVAEVGDILADHQAAFHVDAVQVMGKILVHPADIKADFLSASAHKFHGPKGVGFLYHKAGLRFDPLIHGGEQEEKRRAGTENLHSLVGMARALEIAQASLDEKYAQVASLKQHLLDGLEGLDYYLNRFGESLPYVINIGLSGQNHDLLLTRLDMEGIAISTGSACTAGTVEPSHVLEAVYGKADPRLKENIRVSFSELNSFEDIDQFLSVLKKIIQ